MKRPGLVVATLASGACLLFGCGILYSEAATLAYGAENSSRIDDYIASGNVRFGYSYYSQKRLMGGCMNGMISISHMLRSEEDQQSFARTCKAQADAIVQQSPLDGFAWVVSAQAASILKDNEAMNRGLVNSWTTTRNEQWISTFRLKLADTNYDLLNEQAREANVRDMQLHVMSEKGIRIIADRYVRQPEFRERITSIVSSMPNDRQRRFLGLVTAGTRKRQPG